MQAYCFKCKKKVEVKNPSKKKLKTGAIMTTGKDTKGHKVSVIGKA